MRFAAYAALTALLSFNRETGLVLVLVYMAYFAPEWHCYWRRFLLLALCWGAVQAALHLALGSADHVLGLVGTFDYNLNNLPDALFANLLFLPVIVMLIVAYRGTPPLFKRLLWVAGLYLLAAVVGGAWSESQRLLLPIIPLCLPTLLCQYKD